jgi:hypothetical protein
VIEAAIVAATPGIDIESDEMLVVVRSEAGDGEWTMDVPPSQNGYGSFFFVGLSVGSTVGGGPVVSCVLDLLIVCRASSV